MGEACFSLTLPQAFPALTDRNFMRAGTMSVSSREPSVMQVSNKYLLNPLNLPRPFLKSKFAQTPEDLKLLRLAGHLRQVFTARSAEPFSVVGQSLPGTFPSSTKHASLLPPSAPADVLWTEAEASCRETGKPREIQANLTSQVKRHSHQRTGIQLSKHSLFNPITRQQN